MQGCCLNVTDKNECKLRERSSQNHTIESIESTKRKYEWDDVCVSEQEWMGFDSTKRARVYGMQHEPNRFTSLPDFSPSRVSLLWIIRIFFYIYFTVIVAVFDKFGKKMGSFIVFKWMTRRASMKKESLKTRTLNDSHTNWIREIWTQPETVL